MTSYLLLLLLLIGGCMGDQDAERRRVEEGTKRADAMAGFFKEQAGGRWTPAAVRNLSASLTSGDFVPQQTLAELGILTGGAQYRIAHVQASLEAVAQRMEAEAQAVAEGRLTKWTKMPDNRLRGVTGADTVFQAAEWVSGDTAVYAGPRYIRVHLTPAKTGEIDTVYFKAVGLDTLQYALELLDRWAKAFDDRRYVGGPGNLKAKTDSLLNNPVIRERRVIR